MLQYDSLITTLNKLMWKGIERNEKEYAKSFRIQMERDKKKYKDWLSVLSFGFFGEE